MKDVGRGGDAASSDVVALPFPLDFVDGSDFSSRAAGAFAFGCGDLARPFVPFVGAILAFFAGLTPPSVRIPMLKDRE